MRPAGAGPVPTRRGGRRCESRYRSHYGRPLAIQFAVSDQYQDVGRVATGLMIATLPALIL